MGPFLRPRSAGEILDAAFQIFRAHFTRLLTAMAVLLLPIFMLRLVVPLEGAWLVEPLANLFYMAAGAAVVVMVSDAYLGRTPHVRGAIGMVGQRFLSVWGASIIQGVVVGVGFVLLIVPGFIFGAWTFAMIAAVMLENRGAGESFTRSRALAKGNVLRILKPMVVAWILVLVPVMGAGIALELLLIDAVHPGLAAALGDVVWIACYAFVPTVGTVLYYDLRIRDEAFDVEVAAGTLGVDRPHGVTIAG